MINILNWISDESTCCDDDFTWVCNSAKEKQREPNTLQYSFASLPNALANSSVHSNAPSETNSLKSSKLVTRQGSLDRRRVLNRNRQERDSKSRSAHSLQESSPSTDFAEPTSKTLHMHQKNNGGSVPNKYSHHTHQHHRSKAPQIFWERPYFPHWDPNLSHCSNYHARSREDVRMLEYNGNNHHRRHHDYYRCDSDGMLNMAVKKQRSPVINGNGNNGPANVNPRIGHMLNDDNNCCSRYYSKPMSYKSCCPCENMSSSSPPHWNKRSQVRNAFSCSFNLHLICEWLSNKHNNLANLLINNKYPFAVIDAIAHALNRSLTFSLNTFFNQIINFIHIQ